MPKKSQENDTTVRCRNKVWNGGLEAINQCTCSEKAPVHDLITGKILKGKDVKIIVYCKNALMRLGHFLFKARQGSAYKPTTNSISAFREASFKDTRANTLH